MANSAFWDVDTQNDYMLPQGRHYLKGAEGIRPALKRLYAFARKARLPVIASADAYSPSDARLKDLTEHCVRGSDGQKKVPETRFARPVVVPNDRRVDAPALRPGMQVILEKIHHDAFSNPAARVLVEKSGIDRWAVFGVATDFGVRLAALGLLKLGKEVTVVSDAVHGVSEEGSRQALMEMQAAGADVLTSAAVIKAFSSARRSLGEGGSARKQKTRSK
jgi:nicotinamidase/pyrazinamidase